jgi:transcription antitermination factor NusG
MIELTDTAKWYCAVTQPSRQRRVELELASLGFRNFTPKIKKWVTHARVRKAVERPLLGRYLFVEIDYPRQSFAAVRATNGVDEMVSNLGRPLPIPSHWVEGLMRRYLAGEWDYVRQDPVTFINGEGKTETRHNQPLSIGCRIRVMEGEFADMLATVTGVKRGKVTFKVLGTAEYGSLTQWGVRAA